MPEPLNIAEATGRLGILTPGMGAVASTAYAGVIAARKGLAAPVGSLTQMAHIRLGERSAGRNPLIREFVPLAELDDLVFGGWDPISPNALEAARTKKLIGHPLDAAVTISVTGDAYDKLQPFAAELRSILIVSRASLVTGEAPENAFRSDDVDGLLIGVAPAPGDKCERCWVHDTTVGSHSEQPTICQRCQDALEQII